MPYMDHFEFGSLSDSALVHLGPFRDTFFLSLSTIHHHSEIIVTFKISIQINI